MKSRCQSSRRICLHVATWVAVALGIPSFLLAADPPAVDPLAGADLPTVVARVGDVEVTRMELLTQARLMRAQIVQATERDPALEEGFLRVVLEGLIDEALLFLDSQRRGIAAGDAEIDARLAAMASSFDTPEAFDQALAAQGSDRDKLRRQLRQALSIERALAQAQADGQRVTEEQKRAFYRERQGELTLPPRYKLRHILIRRTEDASRLDDRLRAEQALARIRSGEDFARVAAEVSEDAATRATGGELPWVSPSGGAGNVLDEAVAKLQPGGMTIVETDSSYHVIELLERRGQEVMPYEEVEARIEEMLREQGAQRIVQERVQALRGTIPIEIML